MSYPQQQMMPRIYISGPVNTVRPGSECDQLLNISRMCEAADDLIAIGCVPIVPALNAFLHMMRPQTRAYWLAKSESDMQTCVAVYRIAGKSAGADNDNAYAGAHGIEWFANIDALASYLREHYPFVHEAIDKGMPEYVSEVVAANSPFPELPVTPDNVHKHYAAMERRSTLDTLVEVPEVKPATDRDWAIFAEKKETP